MKNLKLQQSLNDQSKESLTEGDGNKTNSQSPSNRKLRESRNSLIGTELRTFDSNRRGKSVYGPSSQMDQMLWKKKEYIGPGNIGTVKTLTLWNKASEITTGTTKTNTLRLDQYTSRTDITKQYKNSKVLALNPHNKQFDIIDKLPKINSKYRNTYQHQIKNTIGRLNQPTEFYKPHKNGNDVNIAAPNSPARTAFYNTEIPKFYPGQPGYKNHLKQMKLDQIHKTKPMVEWNSDLWGEIKQPKIFNLPG